jgi:hypothetical protein
MRFYVISGCTCLQISSTFYSQPPPSTARVPTTHRGRVLHLITSYTWWFLSTACDMSTTTIAKPRPARTAEEKIRDWQSDTSCCIPSRLSRFLNTDTHGRIMKHRFVRQVVYQTSRAFLSHCDLNHQDENLNMSRRGRWSTSRGWDQDPPLSAWNAECCRTVARVFHGWLLCSARLSSLTRTHYIWWTGQSCDVHRLSVCQCQPTHDVA